MYRNFKIALIALSIAAISACTMTTPRYDSDPSNAITLKTQALTAVKVGQITKQRGSRVESVSIRGTSLQSANGSFENYIRDALVDELDHAELLDQNSTTQIDGVLLRNELDGSGLHRGYGEIEMQFTVSRDHTILFDKKITAQQEWRSNALGALALSRAAYNYPLMIKKLLGKLLKDPDFIVALKKN